MDVKPCSGYRRLRVACVVVSTIAVVSLGLARDVRAQEEETFLSFVSDPGDFIGGGVPGFFTRDTASIQSTASNDNQHVNVIVFPFEGGFWFLDLAAPQGQALVPGVYESATRWPFQAPTEPGLNVSGDGRGCNMLTGRFEVLEARYGPAGYVERFHASFEQHCEGAAPALRGEVRIINPPPPPILDISMSLAERGTANLLAGTATLGVRVQCSANTTVNISGVLQQRATRFALASGSFSLSVPCAAEATTWSVTVAPQGSVPFGAGMALAEVTVNGFDPNYGTFVTEQFATAVRLNGRHN